MNPVNPKIKQYVPGERKRRDALVRAIAGGFGQLSPESNAIGDHLHKVDIIYHRALKLGLRPVTENTPMDKSFKYALRISAINGGRVPHQELKNRTKAVLIAALANFPRANFEKLGKILMGEKGVLFDAVRAAWPEVVRELIGPRHTKLK